MTDAPTTVAPQRASAPTRNSSGPPRVGIAGAGFITDFHIRALKTLPLEIAAVCDPKADRAAATQRKWNLPASYGGLGEMLAEANLDIVHILAPPSLHKAAALQCLEAGVDVFLEKPAAVNTAECEELRAAAARYGRKIGVNHNAVFHPAFRRVVAAVQDCRLGAVQHVFACVNVPLRQLQAGQHGHWMFQKPGNIVLEQGPHPLSQIFTLAGNMEQCSVLASGAVQLNSGVWFYDTWQISMVCERATAHCFLSFGKDCLDNWVHVIGEDAAATADLRRNVVRIAEKTRFMEPVDNYLVTRRGGKDMLAQGFGNLKDYIFGFLGLTPPADPFTAGMRGSIQAFHNAWRSGAPLPVSLTEATEVIRACELIDAGRGRL